MKNKIAILAGDGIGPEIIVEAEKVLAVLQSDHGLSIELEHAPVGAKLLLDIYERKQAENKAEMQAA